MMPRCCVRCFNDAVIVGKISSTGQVTRCSYCGSTQVSCIEPAQLADKLELFTYGLREDENGQVFPDILSRYGIFSELVRDINVLVDDIFGAGASNKKYSFDLDVETYSKQWEDFKIELKHKNRFFPKATIYSSLFNRAPSRSAEEVFFQLLEQLTVPVNARDNFFRARISEQPLGAGQMGCPPPQSATGGRANPVGIPYLYTSDAMQACIAEVRPNNTSCIYVSHMTPVRELAVLDLTAPRKLCSASSFEEQQLAAVLGFLDLLELFSVELSKPVRPENTNLDYIPTQFLSEFIKSEAMLDGLVFNSSFGDGANYVFFDPDSLTPSAPQQYIVTRTVHEFGVAIN